MVISVYLASKYEYYSEMKKAAAKLQAAGINTTSKWVDLAPQSFPTPEEAAMRAQMDLGNITESDVLVIFNPKEFHRSGTGGRHVETGYAIALKKPIILVGERENVFHHLSNITVIPDSSTLEQTIRSFVKE
jgi:nucleoside 2-deoxyribosyltransferase